jgi:hypothetical protein
VTNPTRSRFAARNGYVAALAVLLAPLVAGPASAAVPGLELELSGSGPPDSAPSHTAIAECPDGKGLLGLGGKSEGGGGEVVLDALAADNDSVTVRGSEDEDGTNARWNVVAYAICADQGAGRGTTFNEVPDSDSPKQRDFEGGCGLGRLVTGVGGEIPIGATGEVMLDGLIPSPELDNVLVRGIEDDNGTEGLWSLRPYRLCADPLPGLDRIEATSASSSRNKHATARCPAGKRVVGTGGEIVGGSGHVAMQYMIPDPDLTKVHVRGAEDQDGTNANWAVRAYAICANG